eukprot:COSAG01_NODE_7199_length_3308_cov_2.577127_1_plen_212_part_00
MCTSGLSWIPCAASVRVVLYVTRPVSMLADLRVLLKMMLAGALFCTLPSRCSSPHREPPCRRSIRRVDHGSQRAMSLQGSGVRAGGQHLSPHDVHNVLPNCCRTCSALGPLLGPTQSSSLRHVLQSAAAAVASPRHSHGCCIAAHAAAASSIAAARQRPPTTMPTTCDAFHASAAASRRQLHRRPAATPPRRRRMRSHLPREVSDNGTAGS